MFKRKYKFYYNNKFNKLFSKLNIPTLSFLITLSLCGLALYVSSVFELRDYSSFLGFSSESFDYRAFSDGEFYKESLDYYSNWNFLKNIGQSFVAGPIVPFILTKLSFEKLYVIFSLFSLLISLSVYFYVSIICKYFKPSTLSYVIILLIIVNPFNYYFVLKPGSEIPFQFLYSLFNLTFLNTFYYYKLIVRDKLNKKFKFRIYLYSLLLFLLILILTRPTSLIIGYILIFYISYLLIFTPNKIKFFKKDLL